MTPLDEYIYSKPQDICDLLDFLNSYILSIDEEMVGTIKWKIPCYSRKRSLCYLNVLKDGRVELNFIRARSFKDELQEYLDFGKRKSIGGVKYKDLIDIDTHILELLFEEALQLDA